MPSVPRPAEPYDFSVKLSTGTWTVIRTSFQGLTVWEGKVSIVHYSVSEKNYLDSHVHEALHAAERSFSEAEVVRLAKDITAYLWAAGYRRT